MARQSRVAILLGSDNLVQFPQMCQKKIRCPKWKTKSRQQHSVHERCYVSGLLELGDRGVNHPSPKSGRHGRFLAGKEAIVAATSPRWCCRSGFLFLKIQPRTKPWRSCLPWWPWFIYICNEITKTWIQISLQSWNGFSQILAIRGRFNYLQ